MLRSVSSPRAKFSDELATLDNCLRLSAVEMQASFLAAFALSYRSAAEELLSVNNCAIDFPMGNKMSRVVNGLHLESEKSPINRR